MDKETILFYVAMVLSLFLIGLVIAQPRQTQVFSSDTTSKIGKPSYWRTNRLVKITIFTVAIALVLVLLIFFVIEHS